MESKLWSGDITTLTTQEVMDIIGNMFYQIFLVQVSAVNFAVKTDESGTYVKFVIDGEAYRDEANLDTADKLDIEAEEEELGDIEQ